ncbi:PREDICTED: potassium channel subfamily K member 17 [Galeopterus variegatus]|uniref:Potassium channel subfamily K member 17 n=1 Tax=Galeopterus variegatus TaxID=482537 RepID=A0ABM0SER7_GALVR|nr:PREDICTED: potassium channel subfamily K member 17 [Galeopterus variegatus]
MGVANTRIGGGGRQGARLHGSGAGRADPVGAERGPGGFGLLGDRGWGVAVWGSDDGRRMKGHTRHLPERTEGRKGRGRGLQSKDEQDPGHDRRSLGGRGAGRTCPGGWVDVAEESLPESGAAGEGARGAKTRVRVREKEGRTRATVRPGAQPPHRARWSLQPLPQDIAQASKDGANLLSNTTSMGRWELVGSFFFSVSTITTIGYGNLRPHTMAARLFCIFFALVGIPLNLVVLNRLGHLMQHGIYSCARRLGGTWQDPAKARWLAGSGTLLSGLLLFSPRMNPSRRYPVWYKNMVSLWILFGMAWLALIIKLILSLLETPGASCSCCHHISKRNFKSQSWRQGPDGEPKSCSPQQGGCPQGPTGSLWHLESSA